MDYDDSFQPARRNRWAVPALVLAIVGLAMSILTYVAQTMGTIWLSRTYGAGGLGPVYMRFGLFMGFAGLLWTACKFASLILGTAAVVQVRQNPDTQTGKGLGLVAILITLIGALLMWVAQATLVAYQMLWMLK